MVSWVPLECNPEVLTK
ncbi:unnamed protein product, partial [Allacma fusca]